MLRCIMHWDDQGVLVVANATTGLTVAYVGDPPDILFRAPTDWPIFQRRDGLTVALVPGLVPEDLPIDPGYRGWRKVALADLGHWMAA